MKTSRLVLSLLAATACVDAPATGPDPSVILGTAVAAIAPTSNPACTIHWASGVAGSWFDATKWNPAVVPGPASSVCIDAPGTYMVTLDPVTDATPVAIAALDLGGAGAVPTLRLTGTSTIMNLTQGIMVGANAVLDLRNFTGATITSQGTLTNQGTVAAVAACGNCGTGNVINADIINQGTLHSAAMVALGKVNGAVENSGAITFGNNGEITIPATAGNPTFSQNGGSITGNGNFTRLNMLAGTFTMNGGKARQRLPANKKPVVILDGANLVMTAGATDSAVIGVLARSATTPTIAGDVRALTTLWLGGSVDGQPGSVAFTGNPTNLGTITTVRQIDTFGGQLTIAGTGRLTNAGLIDQSLNSGAQAVFTYTIEVTNSGTHKLATSSGATFSKVGGSYVNTGTIDMTASVAVLTILGSTLTSTGIITGGSVRVDAGGRLKATGLSPTTISPINGGVVEPGLSLGLLTVNQFTPATTGVLRIELGGATAGTTYDQLDATVVANLQGTLDVVGVNGFAVGMCGQQFDVLTHPRASGYGTFGTINGLNPAPGRQLRVVYINATATTKGIVRLIGFDGASKVCVGQTQTNISEGGAGSQYAIALDHAPSGSVVVTATPDAQVTVSPSSLTFTSANWQMPQFFTVTAVDDAVYEGTHSGTVTHAVATTDASYQGFVPSPLTASIADNDVAGPPPPPPTPPTPTATPRHRHRHPRHHHRRRRRPGQCRPAPET